MPGDNFHLTTVLYIRILEVKALNCIDFKDLPISFTFVFCILMHSCFRWLQIAKKVLAKSKKDGESVRTGHTMARRPLPQPQSGNCLANSARVAGSHLPNFPRTFNGSENDLVLAYNSSLTRPVTGGCVRYSPDGRASPEVQMYKTRVIYHSRQDCAEQLYQQAV